MWPNKNIELPSENLKMLTKNVLKEFNKVIGRRLQKKNQVSLFKS